MNWIAIFWSLRRTPTPAKSSPSTPSTQTGTTNHPATEPTPRPASTQRTHKKILSRNTVHKRCRDSGQGCRWWDSNPHAFVGQAV